MINHITIMPFSRSALYKTAATFVCVAMLFNYLGALGRNPAMTLFLTAVAGGTYAIFLQQEQRRR